MRTHETDKDERASPSPSISLLTPPRIRDKQAKSTLQNSLPFRSPTTHGAPPPPPNARVSDLPAAKNNLGRARRSRLPLEQRKGHLGFTRPWIRPGLEGINASQVQVHSPRKSVATVVSFPFLALFSNELVEPLGLLSNASVLHRTSQVLFAIHQPAPLLHKPNATQRNAATTTCMNRIALRVKDSSRRNSD